MRKRLMTPTLEPVRSQDENWLDLEHAAVVEVTSEEKDFPVEAALVFGEAQGWRAAENDSAAVRSATLTIVPDISGGAARASLKSIRLSPGSME
jgi:hypothetical protein